MRLSVETFGNATYVFARYVPQYLRGAAAHPPSRRRACDAALCTDCLDDALPGLIEGTWHRLRELLLMVAVVTPHLLVGGRGHVNR